MSLRPSSARPRATHAHVYVVPLPVNVCACAAATRARHSSASARAMVWQRVQASGAMLSDPSSKSCPCVVCRADRRPRRRDGANCPARPQSTAPVNKLIQLPITFPATSFGFTRLIDALKERARPRTDGLTRRHVQRSSAPLAACGAPSRARDALQDEPGPAAARDRRHRLRPGSALLRSSAVASLRRLHCLHDVNRMPLQGRCARSASSQGWFMMKCELPNNQQRERQRQGATARGTAGTPPRRRAMVSGAPRSARGAAPSGGACWGAQSELGLVVVVLLLLLRLLLLLPTLLLLLLLPRSPQCSPSTGRRPRRRR